MSAPTEEAREDVRLGVVYATAAYTLWGAFPLFFHLVAHVPSFEVLMHRALWALPSVALILAARDGFSGARAAFASPKVLATLALTSVIIMANWLIFIWAVSIGRVLDSSLGYFINPLLYVAMGAVLLGERLNRAQVAAVALAAVGVAILTAGLGRFPWVSIALAVTFGLYGLLRKRVDANAATGLFVETTLIAPFALGVVVWLGVTGAAAFGTDDVGTSVLLALGGPVTALPLLLFALGARRLRLSTIGLLQYIGPTGQFFVGLALAEDFTLAHAISFAFIWAGIAVFATDAILQDRRRAVAPSPGSGPRPARTAGR